MVRQIKKTASTFGGYLYQNLIGLEQLCDWLEDPDRYEWVKFESDEDEIPRGLDDIVARRNDGTFTLFQVKFTVDPDEANNKLSWAWLLQHKPKGRSLLQKWFRAYSLIQPCSIFEAALITNRLPDREFERCLDSEGCRVELTKIPDTSRIKVIRQIGSEDLATEFFNHYEFRHSHQGYTALQQTLLDRYVPNHTHRYGWHVLFESAIQWSIRHGYPPPDGRITLQLLRGVLHRERPEPLNQSFEIPDGYHPPDEEFAEEFIRTITSGTRRNVILWGSPGQGKSTFLSFVCTELESKQIPYVRHHYFLKLSDTSRRYSYPEVADSLMSQMEVQHIKHVQELNSNPNPEDLWNWIHACAEGYGRENKIFIVVIDGLDHVWRENEGDRRPLDSLFSQIFPLPDNVVLVVGTQKVADAHLPTSFSTFVKSTDWIELPSMSMASTRAWLQLQLEGNRFELPDAPLELADNQITGLAESFHRSSGGHPLHLVYSFENVVHENRILTPDLIKDLPDCPNGDIRIYYQKLWQRLSYSAKDALFLVAESDFIWPTFGLEDCLEIKYGDLDREIGHLFYVTTAGRIPFHESILAFVRSESDYSTRIAKLLPRAVEWLESKAPVFLRWGWLWLLKTKNGQAEDLVTKPDRDWVISSLAKAYPLNQIIQVLSVAETKALESRKFARAIRIRLLKTRTLNGTDFQVDDYNRVFLCASALNDDDYPLLYSHANVRSASINELYVLAKQLISGENFNAARECQDLMRKRINDRIRARALREPTFIDMVERHLEIVAATRKYEPHRLVDVIANFGQDSDKMFQGFLRNLSKHCDLTPLMSFVPCSISEGMRFQLDLALVRLAGVCKASLHNWTEFEQLRHHPIVSCWVSLYSPDQARSIEFEVNASSLDSRGVTYSESEETERYLHGFFFHVLSKCLEARGVDPVIRAHKFENRMWLNTAVKYIEKMALSIGATLANWDIAGYDQLFRILQPLEKPRDHNDLSEYSKFRRALLEIASDVFFLTTIRSGLDRVPTAQWQFALDSGHLPFSEWKNHYVSTGHKIFDDQAIQGCIQNRLNSEKGELRQFGERANGYLDLCELALFQGLTEIGQEALSSLLDCVLGYGWHKDLKALGALDAIETVSEFDAESARALLFKITPAIAVIDEVTDGDETRHAKFEMAHLLLELMPCSYAQYYEFLLRDSAWYDAENVYSSLVEALPLASPMADLLTVGLLDHYSINTLRGRGENGENSATDIVKRIAEFFATAPDEFAQDRFAGSTSIDEDHGLDVASYRPENLDALLEEIRARNIYAGRRTAIREWFDYWMAQGRKAELLRSLEKRLDDTNSDWEMDELLDDGFLLSLDLEGKNHAYKWIVAAQIRLNGWDRYYDSKGVEQRFEYFARHYKNKWDNFIVDTSKSRYKSSKDNVVIPQDRLVRFLVSVGQNSVALEVAEQMVDALIEDFIEQPIETPTWLVGH